MYVKFTNMRMSNGNIQSGSGHWTKLNILLKRGVKSITYHVIDTSGLERGGNSLTIEINKNITSKHLERAAYSA